MIRGIPLALTSLVATSAVLGQAAEERSPLATTRNAVHWRHPAGLVTDETIAEVKDKIAAHDWARRTYVARKQVLDRWVEVPFEQLQRVFPKNRGNVYHNFSCPADRCRLTFGPFVADQFKCPSCGKSYAPETGAGIYGPNDRYHGTMYDGWICMFYLESAAVAADLGLVGRVETRDGDKYSRRGIDLLLLYADTIEHLATKVDQDPQMSVLLTYHREGDSKVLNDLACAYELLRDQMTPEQRRRFERVVLQRMLDDIMLEPIYTYNHNNLYQWHRTIVQTALALEREDLLDWSFGYGPFDPEHKPEHRSMRRLLATHFMPDGAYWEMCSGYHLYPLNALCEFAVLAHNLARMDPGRFPADRYDLTDRANPGGQVIIRALEWFMSMAMPDRTMPTVGDSMAPRAGMDDYYMTAEVGYRFFDLKAVGDYAPFRQGQRTWAGLVYGAPQIVQSPTAFTSSCLSSGWVSLRNEWHGNRVWLGLNALIPGGGHQHADRLSLLSYSQDKLLALEKATPYNEAVTRELGTFSQSHNTVTVDQASQKQGEALLADETPKVAFFFAGPVVKFAEMRADHLCSQTSVYRRSVALIEDIYVDLFQVRGGTTHDWLLNHTGAAPRFSMPMQDAGFAPAEWLTHGTQRIRHARIDQVWDARWSVDDVTSRLTMIAAGGTEVYALQTYPVDTAVVTSSHPPCETLCVRRHSDAPFLAIGDAWRESPNLKIVSPGNTDQTLRLVTASHLYYLAFGPVEARFDDGASLKSDATFTVWRDDNAMAIVGGTGVELQTRRGKLGVSTDRPVSVSVERPDGTIALKTAGDIHYDTYGGVDHLREPPPVAVTFSGDPWPQIRIEKEVPYLGPGRNEKCDLYLPANPATGQRFPGIVIIHGGGWRTGDKANPREQNIATNLVPHGYACMSINYLLGKETGSPWPRNLHDCKSAVQFLRKYADQYQVDADQIGVIGGSAGGHLAAMVGLTGPEVGLEPDHPYPGVSSRVQAVVDLYGIAHLATKYADQGHTAFLGVTKEQNPALWALASPVTHASAGDPPFLILHGTADTTVPYQQSVELNEVLRKLDVESQCVLIDGAPHTFHLQPKQRDLRPLVIEFFDKHLKPK